ncbi:MAG: hypothetical protein AMDU1_APLC00021G0026 [Thermoplasmatales archaeon A-plasma]|jgi:hypothetical protein|nr:MAG: hypothetical protein AMDU1_APLC00021G0026 [Thermoplasmatales archaeon A-plasma]
MSSGKTIPSGTPVASILLKAWIWPHLIINLRTRKDTAAHTALQQLYLYTSPDFPIFFSISRAVV